MAPGHRVLRLTCTVTATGTYGRASASSRGRLVGAIPRISKLHVSRRSVVFTLNEDAVIRLTITERRHKPRTTIIDGHAGTNRTKKLKPGHFRLTLTAIAAGFHSATAKLGVTIRR